MAQALHQSGYDVIFVGSSDGVVGQLNEQSSYRVREIGSGARDYVVDGYSAINSTANELGVVEAIASADLVTTSVGANNLAAVAPILAEGIAARGTDTGAIPIIACENGIGGTELLASEVLEHGELGNAIFANCAVDRIVPHQDGSLDVSIEAFSEWVVDSTPFAGGHTPNISGVTWVKDLAPYVERKLFTVNTGHAAIAYRGHELGYESIGEALAHATVEEEVRSVLEETKKLLVEKHGFSVEEHQQYIETALERMSNPQLPDTCERVGRGPLRKLSRNERLIAPAAELAERGHPATDLLNTVGAALRFDVPEDGESVRVQRLLGSGAAASDIATAATGIEADHPLFFPLVEVVETRLAG